MSLTEFLENAMFGVIYLDPRGSVLEANAYARSVFMCGKGLSYQERCLRCRLPDDDMRLRKLLGRALPAAACPAGGSITVERFPGMPRLAVHVSPRSAHWRGFVRDGVAALVLIVDPAMHPCIDTERVAATLGLTGAESAVAVALASGKSVREIAAATNRKESSVRWLIKQIHAKLRISRNTDLVRMVLLVAWGTALWPAGQRSDSF